MMPKKKKKKLQACNSLLEHVHPVVQKTKQKKIILSILYNYFYNTC